ncbi:MAG: flagellar hook-basal body complex protein [Oscillospiraceae bacterium]|jgi:flagellar basal-body rod protein FlgG|nr:flagellar hook-basal body complex protein [Oscillospiraceae bacterium]
MLSEFYTIASGLMAQQKKLETEGNNIVNSQTPGYRTQRTVAVPFEKELYTRLENGDTETIGPHTPATIVKNVATEFNVNNIRSTDRNMDVAINGNGYFTVLGSDGKKYITRNGSFDVDTAGYLELPNYGRVLGINGQPIQVGDTKFTVMSGGTVMTSGGQQAGTVMLTVPAANAELTQYANGMFAAPANAPAGAPTTGVSLKQKALESSNVDLNREMSLAMASQSALKSCSTALQIVDQLNQKAASQIASV